MKIVTENSKIYFNDITHFNLKETLTSGQTFRFTETEIDGFKGFLGYVENYFIKVYQKDNSLVIYSNNNDPLYWQSYFNLDVDFDEILESISRDNLVKEAMTHYDFGIRLIKQNLFETIITFLCSQNNSIPNITRIINNLCMTYGEKITYEDMEYYAFPTVESLSNADLDTLKQCKTGYRNEYILNSSKAILNKEIDLDNIINLNTDDAKVELMKLHGIGPKVADCILLFSLRKYDAFPTDVWVKKIMQQKYNVESKNEKNKREKGREIFGPYAGYAQQYLFHYYRTTGEL